MKDNLRRQQEQYLKVHGIPMSDEVLTKTMDILLFFQGLYFEEADAGTYPDRQFWEGISAGLHVSDDLTDQLTKLQGKFSPEPINAAQVVQLRERGFAVLDSAHLLQGGRGTASEAESAAVLAALVQTIHNLRAHGWPPCFIFVYDELWLHVVYPLFDIFEELLGEGCFMEPDLNCWSLRAPEGGNASGYVGANFGASHRDMTYSACHNDKGDSDSLNAWVSINSTGATSSNGCMHVIPIEHDDYFYSPRHPYHMDNEKGLSFLEDLPSQQVVMQAPSGAVCTWTPSLIHWGGECKVGELDPRISVAATFRNKAAVRSAFGSGPVVGSSTGPPPIARHGVRTVGLSRRLSYAAKALLSYSHWYPGFPGVSLELCQRALPTEDEHAQEIRPFRVDGLIPDVLVAQRSAAVSTGCTGLRVWSSALLLGAELAKAPGALKGCSVVELGCGCGLAGVVAAACGASVVLTDRDAGCMRLVAITAAANAAAICDAGGSIAFTSLDWEHPTRATTCSLLRFGATDVVISSDPLYTTTGAITLPRAAKALLAPHGKLICLIGVRESTGGQATLSRFLAESYAAGLELIGDLQAVASSTISSEVAKTYWTDAQLAAEKGYFYLEMRRRASD
ncbi:unnamed protein product [Prorocentrum cordatum]|uniref:Calmodulin-lysine N-methyltransferase n=1 Tax=Prorocentrum cordatum TaxID=2364126 RepID=A0ABN9XT77_9DINO|nr:unnamed protein product [Polarella glacialis]